MDDDGRVLVLFLSWKLSEGVSQTFLVWIVPPAYGHSLSFVITQKLLGKA